MGSAVLSGGQGASFRNWTTIALLSGLYFISFVDRVILALLVQPLKADLGVSDVQLGILFGPAFAVFYAVVGLPLARLADRGHRVRLIVAGALVWGACTVASGFADTYLMLVVLRVGLAIGEATLTPAAYSLIGASFPAHLRVRAASIYSAVGIAGAAASYILGAAVIQAIGPASRTLGPASFETWQLVFIAVGAPAVLGALLVWLVAREPARDRDAEPPSLRGVWLYLQANRAMYFPLFAGAGILQAVNAAYAAWGPEYLRRSLGWEIRDAGLAFGSTGLVGASLGVLLIPMIGKRLHDRGWQDAIAVVAAAAGLLGGLAATLGPVAGSAQVFLLCNLLAAFGLYGSSTGLVVAMQTIAPLEIRATLVALLLLAITLLGQGLGPPAVAVAAGWFGDGGLGLALGAVSLAAVLPGLALLAAARGPLGRYLAAGGGR